MTKVSTTKKHRTDKNRTNVSSIYLYCNVLAIL